MVNSHGFLTRLIASPRSTGSLDIIGVLRSGGLRTAQHSALRITSKKQRNQADRGEAQLKKRHSQVQWGEFGVEKPARERGRKQDGWCLVA